MGREFKLISDKALIECVKDYTCDMCDKKPSYYHPTEINEDGSAFEVDYLCCSCVKRYPSFKNFREWKKSLDLCEDISLNEEELSKTPRIPCFIQGYDWPVCCTDLCEFSGLLDSEDDLVNISDKHLFWEKGIKQYSEVYDFELKVSSLKDIGLFNCLSCNSKYFTFQFS